MTKKDYELIAKVICCIQNPEQRWQTADLFSRYLKANNPRFNIVTFQKACKVTEDVLQRRITLSDVNAL